MIRAALVWRGGLAGVVVAAAGCAAIAGIGDLPGPPDASPAGGDAAPDGTRPTTRDASLEASTTHHGDATVRDAGRDAGSRVDSPASTVDSAVDGQADGHADVSSDASVRLDATADVFLPFDAACDANAAAAQTCAGADALFVGALPVGGAITPFVSTMPFGATQAYFSIQFAGNTSPSYHPHITLTSPNDEFLMNVLQDCSGTSASTTCLDNGDNFSLGVTSWETKFHQSRRRGEPCCRGRRHAGQRRWWPHERRKCSGRLHGSDSSGRGQRAGLNPCLPGVARDADLRRLHAHRDELNGRQLG